MTKAQVLTVENPLGMYDGCCAKQRDGKVCGPWKWCGGSNEIVGWYWGDEHRYPDGSYLSPKEQFGRDLIAVVPAPLPEPIERYTVFFEGNAPSDVLWEKERLKAAMGGVNLRQGKTYRVRVEFLEEVTL